MLYDNQNDRCGLSDAKTISMILTRTFGTSVSEIFIISKYAVDLNYKASSK